MYMYSLLIHEERRGKNSLRSFPTRSDTNHNAQSHEMLWTFGIRRYYQRGKNNGAGQLRGYRAADLRLCFNIHAKAGFLMTRPIL